MDNWDVYDDMNLYITPERFLVEPNGKDELLIIDRISRDVKVQSKSDQLRNLVPTRRVCGILGSIHLLGGDYLIVATHRLYVGIINNAIIWRLAGYDIIPYIPTTMHLTQMQRELCETYLSMLRATLDTKFFYFSYWYDLSLTQQRFHTQPKDFYTRGLFERADQRFVWNGYLLRNFNCTEMRRFQLPIILGFVSIHQAQINGQTIFWSLISRRSVQRAGTRFFARGADEEGHAANFVETEQLVEYNGERISFVQTRGSMPFFWRQLPNIRYKPKPELIPNKDHMSACQKHFESQVMLYGNQVAVNLVDQKRAEGELERAYGAFVKSLNNPRVRYEAFDFHAECRKMRWDRLQILIDRLAHEQDEFGVFHVRDSGAIVSHQTGVFRTNCIDCLDRTNVVQSLLARRSLNASLQKLGILSVDQHFHISTKFELLFKGVWADHADVISLQYSGTGALKTDFTRTGKRTQRGLINDGINSLTRYYLNNFSDGFRQDSIDLFLGNYLVNDDEANRLPSPFKVNRTWRYHTLPSVLMFAVAMLFISALFPSELDTGSLLFLLFWGVMIGASTTGILRHGMEFVNWPRLFPIIKFEA